MVALGYSKDDLKMFQGCFKRHQLNVKGNSIMFLLGKFRDVSIKLCGSLTLSGNTSAGYISTNDRILFYVYELFISNSFCQDWLEDLIDLPHYLAKL